MPLDYSGQNLRGRSFRGQNLTGANFSSRDIRSVDFTNAILRGANFRGAKAGLQHRWVIILIVVSLFLSTLSGFVAGFAATITAAKKREQFDLKQRWAVRVQDVYQSLLDFKPQIVHFSGHGGSGDDGLVLEDEAGNERLVETVALVGLFELFANTIECVVLNACYSEVQAGAIAQHIPYVIGMKQAIGDKAAIKFATGFYNALGAGESVEFAYKLGCSVIQLDGIPEHLTPTLKKKQ